MFKLNKVLIKRGFKTILKMKVFSVLMMILIIITGTTYTMLSQATRALEKSFDYVAEAGKLHDYVIKSGFRFSQDQLNNSKINLSPTDSTGAIYDLSNENAQNKTPEKIKTLVFDDRTNTTQPRTYFKVSPVKPKGVYEHISKVERKIYLDGVNSRNDVTASNADDIIKELKVKIENLNTTILNNLQANLSEVVTKEIYNLKLNNKTYSEYLNLRNNNSLFIQNGVQSFNVVRHDKNIQNVNNMVMYDGTYLYTENLTAKQFKDQLAWQGATFNSNPVYKIDDSKSFRQVARPPAGDSTTKAITFTDPNAYQAIVSPAYANANNKRAIDLNSLVNLLGKNPSLGDDLATDKNIQEKYKNNIVTVGNTPYFIIGVGTQPDYMYPIMSGREPIVNASNQAVVFVSPRGYERIRDAFRSNPTENYISLKFKPGVSAADQKLIIKTIEQNLKGINNFPKSVYESANIPLITSYDQENDQLLLTQERVTTLTKVKAAVSSLSYATTSLLIIFLISIVIMIFKTLISGSRKVYATLHALGYSKFQIAVSNAIIAIILVAIPMFIAYGAGYGLQFIFINQFANTWTIPTYGASFSISTLLVVIIIPTLILFAIIFAITIIELKYSIPSMLNGSAGQTIPGIAKVAAKLKILTIKGKYAFALSLKNIGKLTLIMISSIIAMSALTIGFGTIGRADYAYNQTAAMNKYEFAVDFVTPTRKGGQYSMLMPYDINGDPDPAIGKKGTRGITTMPLVGDEKTSGHNVTWHVPKSTDTKYTLPNEAIKPENIEGAANYLKNVIQHKAILDMGDLSKILSVWDIAERLMPDNQKNESNQNYNDIMHNIFDIKLDSKIVDNKSISELTHLYIKKYPGNTSDHVKQLIIDYFNNNLIKAEDSSSKYGKAYKDGKEIIPYTISYNRILTNKGDESYTYMSGFSKDVNARINVKGIKSETTMINLPRNTIENLELKSSHDGTMIIPILINNYLKENWDINVGSTIDYIIENSSSIKVNGKSDIIKAKLNVVGIVDGYNDSGIYTSQKIANQILGLQAKRGFNGIFTKSKNPKMLRTLSLYSPSGLYVPTDSFKNPEWRKYLETYLASSAKSSANKLDANHFIEMYSETPYMSLTSNVRWNQLDKLAFKNVTDMTSTIISIIEAISISLSIIFTVIVAAILFRSNSKKIAALWALGYRKKEINRMFLSMYIMPLLLALALTIPISFAMLTALRVFIISFGHILIPFTLVWWMPLVAVLVVGIIFIASTSITIYTRGSKATIEAFKGD